MSHTVNINQPPAADEVVPLEAYISTILRRYKLAIFVALLVFGGFALYTFSVAPVYQMESTLFVKQDKSSLSVLDELGFGSRSPVEAEILTLTSRTNIEEMAKRLHLEWAISKRPKGIKVKISAFQMPSGEESKTLKITLLGNGEYEATNGESISGRGRVGVPFQSGEALLLFDELSGPEGSKFDLTLEKLSSVVRRIQSDIIAIEAGKKTNVIEVSYRDTDPERGRDIINTLVDVYLDRTIEFNSVEASRSLEFIEKQISEVKKALEQAEGDLENYRKKSGVILLNEEGRNIVDSLTALESRRAQVAFNRKQLELAVSSLRDAIAQKKSYFPSTLSSDPMVGEISKRLAELEVKKQILLADSTEEHPMVRQIESQLVETRSRLLAVYEEGLYLAAREQNSLDDQIKKFDDRLKGLPKAERNLASLTRLSKINSDMYMFLLEKHETARILKASTISNIKVIDKAIVPDIPVKPQKAKNLVLGFLIGILFGLASALLADRLDNTVKTIEDIKRITKLPLLTQIPYMGKKRQRENLNGKEGSIEALISHHSPKSTITEAYRTLRTSLRYSNVKLQMKMILFTSPIAGEGKSTTAANFAVVLAQTGNKVLLMDCDMHRPVVETFFSLPVSPGLTNVLAGEVSVDEAIHETDVNNLSIMPCGVMPPNPTELLMTENMHDILHEVRSMYDYVVIDTPPVMPVSDAQLLGEFVDRVVIVVSAGKSPIPALKITIERLTGTGSPISGIVLSNIKKPAVGYGREYGYGYEEYSGEKESKSGGTKTEGHA